MKHRTKPSKDKEFQLQVHRLNCTILGPNGTVSTGGKSRKDGNSLVIKMWSPNRMVVGYGHQEMLSREVCYKLDLGGDVPLET